MAKSYSKPAVLFIVALVLSLSCIMSLAEGSKLFKSVRFGAQPQKLLASTPTCETVYGVASGDTCFSVMQVFKLSADEFSGINPNLNCNTLFAGQWLCVRGTA